MMSSLGEAFPTGAQERRAFSTSLADKTSAVYLLLPEIMLCSVGPSLALQMLHFSVTFPITHSNMVIGKQAVL